MSASIAKDGTALRPRVLLNANTGWYLRNFRASLVERLEARGFEVILAAPPDVETGGEFFRQRYYEPLEFSRKGRNPILEILAIIRFMKLFRRLRPDLVFTWTPKPNLYGSIAGRMLGMPVIPNVSGLGIVFIRGGIMTRVVGWLYRFAFKQSPVVFFQNEEDRQLFIRSKLVSSEHARRLPGSGVDLRHFTFQFLPVIKPFVFLYIGRLLADKGLRELVAATEMLRRSGHEFTLRLAGFLDPGNPAAISENKLNGWVAKGLVEYLGSFADVCPVLIQAHCVVLPSYREGMPRSLLEGAAMGRPLIASDVPGCRDAVLVEKSGFLCEVRNVESLAECMKRMLDLRPEDLAAMGRCGREYMEREFSEEIVLKAYLEQCERLLRKS